MLPNSSFLKSITPKSTPITQFTASISSLKIKWKRDYFLDEAVKNDTKWRLCFRVVREVLNEPNQTIPLHYLEWRRKRMRLPIKIETFLYRNPFMFDIYTSRLKPRTPFTRFLRPSQRLKEFLEEKDSIFKRNEGLIVRKLCKLLMMSKNRVVSCDKLFEVKRDFGFPEDFLGNLVPRYPEYFRVLPGEGRGFLELVLWNDEFGKSVIELRAEEKSVRPVFKWELPPGFTYRKPMIEWVRDWMEMPYISPYGDGWKLDPATREAEKRRVGVFHELLSLTLYKRMTIDVIGKFCEDYDYSNAFPNTFSRHSGIFYVSLKGGIKTAVLREAYRGSVLIDRDPLLEINEKFILLFEEGERHWHQTARLAAKLKREEIQKNKELLATRGLDLDDSE